MNRKKVCVLLPTLNEAASIGQVIDEIPADKIINNGYDLDILVVDGQSKDNTVEIAKSKGARVIIEPAAGKAAAIHYAFTHIDADYIIMLDSDYTYPTKYIPDMVEKLQKYPVVIGSRLKGKREKGALCLRNLIGNYMLTLLANILYLKNISDLCTGYWGFRKEVIEQLELDSVGFQLEADFLVQISKKGINIGEIPVEYRQRIGKAKLSGWKDGFNIALFLIRKRFKRK